MLELFRSRRSTVVLVVDAALITGTFFVAVLVRFGPNDVTRHAIEVMRNSMVVVPMSLASLYYHGLYGNEPTPPPARLVLKVGQALLLGSLPLWLAYYLLPELGVGRGVFLWGLIAGALAVSGWRLLYGTLSANATFSRRALVLGDGPLARDLSALIASRPLGITLVGMLGPIGASSPGSIGCYDELSEVVVREGVDLVLVAFNDRRGTLPVDQLLSLKFRGVEIDEGVDFYEQTAGKIYVREMRPSHFIFSDGYQRKRGLRRLKRLVDFAGASVGLALSAPIVALAALAIKLDSPGPVLYAQERVGEFGNVFRIFKLRSMRTDAEKNGAQWASADDGRVTRVGRVLRKTRLDELPQLYNVFRSEMSLVGPRPERPVFVEELERKVPFYRQRLCVKPGITGLAQVRCRYAASVEDSLEKLQYDLYYIKTASIWFDFSIIFDTVKVVLLRIGAH